MKDIILSLTFLLVISCAQATKVPTMSSFPPNSPAEFTALSSGDDNVILSWIDKSGTEKGFRLYINTAYNKPGDYLNLVSDTENYIFSNLIVGTTYYFFLESYNNSGSSEVVTAQATVGIPALPTGLRVSYTNSNIYISWHDRADNENGYNIYADITTNQPVSPLQSVGADTESVSLNTYYEGKYYLWVEPYNSNGSNSQMISLWHDEFNGAALNSGNWRIIDSGGGFGNSEAQYYTPREENIAVSNGCLWVTARKENYSGHGYTSAKIESAGKNTFTYGRIEACLTLPYGRGTWPAFWMLGENIGSVGWPACGEIDIMEHVGYDMNRIHGTIHTETYNHMNGTQKGGSTTVSAVDSTWHIYAIEWTADEIAFYVDDQNYFTVTKTECGSSFSQWPFDEPHFLILNLAIGGTWGGAQGIDDSIFPQTLLVDWVRVCY